MSITAIETAIANDLADGNSRTAAEAITQLIRAVIADETPNIVKAMLNTPIEHTTVNLDGKTICTYPVAPDGDVPEWCKQVAKENLSGVGYYDRPDLVSRHSERIQKSFEAELTRRVAEATAAKDRRIAEFEAECERLRNARCNIFSKGNKCDCTLCKQDAEITTLRQQLAEATRPVEDVKGAWFFGGHYVQMVSFQSERAARLAADKRATAAEAERDELREAWKRMRVLMNCGSKDKFYRVRIDEECLTDDDIESLLVAFREFRAEKAKVQQ